MPVCFGNIQWVIIKASPCDMPNSNPHVSIFCLLFSAVSAKNFVEISPGTWTTRRLDGFSEPPLPPTTLMAVAFLPICGFVWRGGIDGIFWGIGSNFMFCGIGSAFLGWD